MLLKIYCEICGEFIAQAKKDDLCLPLMGHMFLSTQPERKVPPPFHPDVDWIYMRCPYGPHRPFIQTNRLMTDRGFVPVKAKAPLLVPHDGGSTDMHASKSIEEFICPHCDRRDFEKKSGYISHVKACARKAITTKGD